MNKKGLRFLLIAIVFMLMFGLSGCINSEAEPFVMQKGVTICPYYDGENYGAQVYFYSDNLYDGTVSSLDTFIFNVLNTEFFTTRMEGYPLKADSNEQFYAVFGYDFIINEKDWFFKDENGKNEEPKVERGFFTAKVNADYINPFSLCFKEGTKFNKIYKAFTEEETGPSGTINDFMRRWSDSFEVDNVITTVLMGGKYTLKTETGGVMFDTDYNYHYYYFSDALGQTKDSRLIYSYDAVQSYAWFMLAIVFGLLAVGLVLLIAKKMSGRVVDAKRKKAVQPTVEFIFDPFDGKGPGQPGGTSGDASGNSGGSGGVFDGF